MTLRARLLRLSVLLAAVLAASAAAEPPALRLPLACSPGADCWIANHVDLDAGPEARDYTCGGFTYEGHSGIDFALRDLAAMRQGVAVLAAAEGTVAGVRDGMADVSVREHGKASVKDRECGNGVRLDHGGGWHTQYCHLRRDSIAVRRGARVRAGDRLGLVGMSGLSEYPHLHFTVRFEGRHVDPFSGATEQAGCGGAERALWEAGTLALLPYAPGPIFNYGVAARLPEPAEVRNGALRARELAADAPSIVVWVEAFGTRAGEALQLRVEGPGGAQWSRRFALEKQARIFRAYGRKRGAALWPAGTYRVTIALDRAGEAGPPPSAVAFTFDVR